MRCYAPDPAGGANSAPQTYWSQGEKGAESQRGKKKAIKIKERERKRG